MNIKTYIDNYTSGNRVSFSKVLDEMREFFIEVVRLNKRGIQEEFQDIIHFFQLWLFWQFGVNGKLWPITKDSTNKFIVRKKVWQKIYVQVGLDKDISNFCGNYNKIEKVIKQLSKFGISKNKSQEAYNKVISKLK